MHRALARLVLTLATLLVVLWASAAVPAGAADSAGYEQTIVRKTNAARVSHGLKPVRASTGCLDRHAKAQAARMAKAKRMYHQDLGAVLRACTLRLVGENVAFGYSTGAAATRAWLRSPGHRANILKAGFRQVGVGAVKASNGRWYSVQLFGTPR